MFLFSNIQCLCDSIPFLEEHAGLCRQLGGMSIFRRPATYVVEYNSKMLQLPFKVQWVLKLNAMRRDAPTYHITFRRLAAKLNFPKRITRVLLLF